MTRRVDAIVAACLAVMGVAATLLIDGTDFTAFARATAAAAAAIPVAFRSTRPVAAAITTTSITSVFTVIDMDYTQSPAPLISFALCAYSMAAATPQREFVRVAGFMWFGVTLSALAADNFRDPLAGLLFGTLVVLFPALAIGRLARTRAVTAQLLEQRAAELEAERLRAPARAAAAERARVADELHELVASGVRRMLDQTAEARRLVAAGDPAGAHAAGRVETSGRTALDDMRRLLGILREGDEALALAPQPTLGQLRALADREAEAGLDVGLRSDGTPRPLAPGVDVAAYRVLEQALDGAHGAGHADVIVRWRTGAVELEVAVDGPQLADVARLPGLRERVELFGGSVRTAQRAGGGSALVAGLPDTEMSA